MKYELSIQGHETDPQGLGFYMLVFRPRPETLNRSRLPRKHKRDVQVAKIYWTTNPTSLRLTRQEAVQFMENLARAVRDKILPGGGVIWEVPDPGEKPTLFQQSLTEAGTLAPIPNPLPATSDSPPPAPRKPKRVKPK
jgi:hypothetical protein